MEHTGQLLKHQTDHQEIQDQIQFLVQLHQQAVVAVVQEHLIHHKVMLELKLVVQEVGQLEQPLHNLLQLETHLQ